MPIYKYKCPDCGNTVERLQEYDSEPPSCPTNVKIQECGDPHSSKNVLLERVIGKPSAHFKSDGFHSTDYNDSSNPASN